MDLLGHIYTFLTRDLYIFSLKDIFEIIFFTSIIYALQKWLRNDTQKNLLLYFYGYCAAFILCHYMHLNSVYTMLLVCSPVALLFFIIMHQSTLQRNFLMLKRITPPQLNFDWFSELTKILLTSMNNKKEFICVIERTDSLSSCIFTGCKFYADIHKESMSLFIEKQVSAQESFIWLNHEGKLVAINATWNFSEHTGWASPEILQLHSWKQNALFITSKTDALIFKINAIDRTFDMIIQGKFLENMSPDQAIQLLKHSIFSGTARKGDVLYSPHISRSPQRELSR